MLHLHDLRGLYRQRARRCRRDHRLSEACEPAGEDAAAAAVQLREHVVEQHQGRRLEQCGLGEQEGENRQSLLALRAELAQVAVSGQQRDLVEMRARAGAAPLQVARETALELRGRRRLSFVGECEPGQPERLGVLGGCV